ncbi:MAG: CopG family transcriptional regulator [Verrucomicrobiota bacterium]
MKTLTVKLPDLLFVEITNAAKLRKVAKSAIVRERLQQASKQQSSLWSRMADLVLEDDALPTDLSSNKKHLQGYGKNRSHR